jgi:nicotinamide mononucleotide transporter
MNHTVEIWQLFMDGMKQTSLLEYIGVFCGIGSVWFSKKESIWVYPVGLVNTILYVYISIKGHLLGEASVNLYYTVMSVYGWILWAKKDERKREVLLHITYSTRKEWLQQGLFFIVFYTVIYYSLSWAKSAFVPGAIPWADAFSSATAYTGMWLMAKKKTESWVWWIATDCASVPLYFVKGYVFTSVQFLILLGLAIMGLMEWIKKANLYKVK